MILSLYSSIFGLYFFALAGFILKKIYQDEIDTKSIVIVSLYVLQPILGLWGFIKAPIIFDMIGIGVLYFFTAFFLAFLFFGPTKFITKDRKQQTILSFLGTSGNTGNIGIPLSSALYGATGVVLASIINFFNILWNFIFGVYFYARGEKSIRDSIVSIFTMPLIWGCGIGLLLNLFSVSVSPYVEYMLEMGAYSAICIQLLLLGIFIAGVKISHIEKAPQLWIIFLKFFLMPIVGIFLLFLYQKFLGNVSAEISAIFIIELCAPLAVNNGNLATLYNCYPQKIAASILISYVFFILFTPVLIEFLLAK